MKYFYFLLLLGVAVPSNLAGGICGNLDDLKTLLCHTFKSYFLKILPPQAHVAIYVFDQYFNADNTSVWDKVKKNVEKYVDDQLTAAAWDDIQNWHDSMMLRVETCKIKTNPKIKISCLKNLQEDMSGYEPHFRGDTKKETALLIRYYDLYVLTFFAVSDELRDLTDDEDVKKSINRDVIVKAKKFYAYLEKAIKEAKYYACRHIKIRIEIKGSWSWKFEEDWPSEIESRDVPTEFANVGSEKRSEEESETNDDADEEVDDIADKKQISCGFWKPKRLRAFVYDTKTKSELTNKAHKTECELDDAKRKVRSLAMDSWSSLTKDCADGLKTKFFLDLEKRLKYIKKLSLKKIEN